LPSPRLSFSLSLSPPFSIFLSLMPPRFLSLFSSAYAFRH
jgi:hypothetical protein